MQTADLADYVRGFGRFPAQLPEGSAWQAIGQLDSLVRDALAGLGDDFRLRGPQMAVHRSATVAESAALTGPVILGPGCRVGPGAILRGGVWADEGVTIGPHSEIKASLIFAARRPPTAITSATP